MRNLIAIYGSPRKGGNTDLLLESFLESIPDDIVVEKIFIRELNFVGCDECNGCLRSGVCIKKDDLNAVFPLILESDHVILSFPIYFLGPPSLTKAFIDRAQHLWVRRFLLKTLKPSSSSPIGCLISCGGFPGTKKIFKCNIAITKAFYNACAVRYAGELVFNGIDKKGDILKVENLDKMIEDFAQRFFNYNQ